MTVKQRRKNKLLLTKQLLKQQNPKPTVKIVQIHIRFMKRRIPSRSQPVIKRKLAVTLTSNSTTNLITNLRTSLIEVKSHLLMTLRSATLPLLILLNLRLTMPRKMKSPKKNQRKMKSQSRSRQKRVIRKKRNLRRETSLRMVRKKMKKKKNQRRMKRRQPIKVLK